RKSLAAVTSISVARIGFTPNSQLTAGQSRAFVDVRMQATRHSGRPFSTSCRPLRRLRVRYGRGDHQLDFGARAGFTPDRQLRAGQLGTLVHARQAVMARASACREDLRVDALSIVAESQPKLPFVVMDIHFDMPRAGVAECVAQRLARNPVDFVPYDRRQAS